MSDAEMYRARLESDPTDNQAFAALCTIAERDGDFEYLSELYKYRAQVTEDAQEIADLYFRAGEVLIDKINDLPRGVEALLQGFEYDKSHAGIGDRLDAIYREAEDWQAALEILEQRLDDLALNDIKGTKLVIRSDLHQQAGEIWERVYQDFDQALIQYKKAIELDRTNLLALYGAREIYYSAGKYKNAAKLCELEARAEKDEERRVALFRELAHLLVEHLAEPDQAVVALKRALKFEPENEEIQMDLARTIAATPRTVENQKDHHWASDYLLSKAEDFDGDESIQFARLSLLALPSNQEALDFVEQRSRSLGRPEELAEAYQQVIDACPDMPSKAPWVRRLAKVFIDDLGLPDKALHWLKKIALLQFSEDLRAISRIERGLSTLKRGEARAEQQSEPPDDGSTVNTEIVPDDELEEISYSGSRSRSSSQRSERGVSDAGVLAEHAQPADALPPDSEEVSYSSSYSNTIFEEDVEGDALIDEPGQPSLAGEPAQRSAEAVPEEMSVEEYVATLHRAAEKARRMGDDEVVEERMLQVLEYAPQDQKATIYLERRFRARGDWRSLRDLLISSCKAKYLPPAAQTVRLREAARLSEEKLADIEGAIDAWKLIRESDAKVRDAADALGRLLAEAQRWEELLEILIQEAESTQSRTKRLEGYRRIAKIYKKEIGDLSAAAGAYQQVLELVPDDEDSLESLDDIYLELNKHEELASLLKKRAEVSRAREAKRDFLMRAAITVREQLKQNEEAYGLCKDILEISHRDQEVLALMEGIDEEEENWGRLIGVLDMRAQVAPSEEESTAHIRKKAHVAMGNLGDSRLAISCWNQLLEMLPGDPEALIELIELNRSAGNFEKLVEVLRQAIEHAEDNEDRVELHKQLARVLEEELEQPEEAMESWRAVVEIAPDAESLAAMCRWFERVGEWEHLIEHLGLQADYLEEKSERGDILFGAAKILNEEMGDPEGAIKQLEIVVTEVDPSHDPALTLLCGLLVEKEDFAKAADYLDQLISYTEDEEDLFELLVTLGDWARYNLEDLQRAMHAYERAVSLKRDDGELVSTLDEVYVQLGEWERLLGLLSDNAGRESDAKAKLEIMTRGARVCEENLGDFDKAWAWCKQIFENLWELDGVIEDLEQAAHRMELWPELIEMYGILTRKTEDVDEQVVWWLKIADVFEEKRGDAGQALEAVLRAFGLRPEMAELLDRVDRLAVNAANWERLATVYGVLVSRTEEPEAKISLLTRYVHVLADDGGQYHDAFDVSLKAFEIDPRSEELLALVEEMAEASERWKDMIRVYNVCTRLIEEPRQRAELKLRCVPLFKAKLDDPEGALASVIEAFRSDCFDSEIAERVWDEVEKLDADLPPPAQGTYWNKLVEVYRVVADQYRREPEKQLALLRDVSLIYEEKRADFVAAFDAMRDGHKVAPKNEEAIARLESLAEQHGLWDALVGHYQDILDETFEMDVAVMLHRRRATVLIDRLDRVEEAADHYWQLIQLDGSDVEAFDKLLAYYADAEKWNELVNLLERKLDFATQDSEKRDILMQIAEVWREQIGNKYEAMDWYEQVVTLWPNDEGAKAAIRELSAGRNSSAPDEEDDEEDEEISALISIPPPEETEDEEDDEEDSFEGSLPSTPPPRPSSPPPKRSKRPVPTPSSESKRIEEEPDEEGEPVGDDDDSSEVGGDLEASAAFEESQEPQTDDEPDVDREDYESESGDVEVEASGFDVINEEELLDENEEAEGAASSDEDSVPDPSFELEDGDLFEELSPEDFEAEELSPEDFEAEELDPEDFEAEELDPEDFEAEELDGDELREDKK